MRALKIFGLVLVAIFLLIVVVGTIETSLTKRRNAAELRELRGFFDTHPNEAAVIEFLKHRGYKNVSPDTIKDDSRSYLMENYEISSEKAIRGAEYVESSKPIGGEDFCCDRDVEVMALFDSSGNLIQEIFGSHSFGP